MDAEIVKKRTRAFGLRVLRLVEALPKTPAGKVIGAQLLKSGTAIGANYRAACRARSRAEFVVKMGVVEEEADETVYWIEMLVDAGLVPQQRVAELPDEANQIVAIVVSSIKTARRKR